MSKKDEQKVITKRSYKYWGLTSNIINAITPILYITFTYDIFKRNKFQGTAYLWIVIIILVVFLKNIALTFIADFNKSYNKTEKRIVHITTLLVICGILIASSYFLQDLVMIILFFALGMLLSLYPYHKYHTNKNIYDRLKEAQTKINDEDDIRSGKIKIK